MRGRVWRTATPVVILLALAGCAGSPAPSRPTTNPPTRLSITEEEALAGMKGAFSSYFAASDAIGQEGGMGVDRIAALVGPTVLKQQQTDAQLLVDNGWRLEGATTFDSVSVQSISTERGLVTIAAYVCADVTDVRVISETGADVTPAERATRVPLETRWEGEQLSALILESSEVWQGENFC